MRSTSSQPRRRRTPCRSSSRDSRTQHPVRRSPGCSSEESVPKAVDISPQRRLDIALRNLSTGVVQASTKNKKAIHECLADEIMLAAKGDMTSYSVAKKEEVERVAQSAR